MRKRTILFILISLALVFGLVGTAAADAPEAVECWIPWWDSNDETYWFPVEGQLVHTGQGFNLSCPYFNFSDPMNASIEHVCQDILGPGGCSGGKRLADQPDEMKFAGGTLEQWRARGHDKNSIIADPLFVAPRQDDFRLKTNSPALKQGFRAIDLRGVGPRE